MPAQATEIRAQLKAIINTAFSTEIAGGWIVLDDKLHRSVGDDGTSRFGISPNADQAWSSNQQIQTTEVLIQFYGAYDLEVDRFQIVDPAAVEAVAERLKRAIKQDGASPTARAWYYNVVRTDYPDDPTGNKTRFELVAQGFGNNPALVETTG